MGNESNNVPLYFESPEKAVDGIKKLLLAEDWLTLARYYDLSRTKTDAKFSDLQSGKYFILTEEPEVKHPGTNWKYKYPFDPGFEFSHIVELYDDTIRVFVRLEIDDGFDKPVVGLQFFETVKSNKGYQLTPGI